MTGAFKGKAPSLPLRQGGLLRSAAVIVFAAATVGGCASKVGSGASGAETTITGSAANTADKSAVARANDATYVIGSGDTLSIFVYRSPELSQEVPVRPDGRISMPLVEDVVASGKTPMVLAREIETKLKKYINEPSVTVTVRTFVGPLDRQVRVIGEAAEPAALAYREHMTLLDVMIATKGLTRFASGNRAVIVRRYEGSQKIINVRLSDLIKEGDISQNIEMLPGDTLIIPQTWF